MMKMELYTSPNHYYFGRRTCAICLGRCAPKTRHVAQLLVEDDRIIAGGRQHVHILCWRGLRDALLEETAQLRREQKIDTTRPKDIVYGELKLIPVIPEKKDGRAV